MGMLSIIGSNRQIGGVFGSTCQYLFFFLDLLQCTHEPNVSIPQLANLLIERTNHSSWVVVFKALITVHHLMCYGNEVSKMNSHVGLLYSR